MTVATTIAAAYDDISAADRWDSNVVATRIITALQLEADGGGDPPPPAKKTAVAADEPKDKRWRITWGHRTWSQNDLRFEHAAAISLFNGSDSWSLYDPFTGPVTLANVLAAFVAIADHRPISDVVVELLEVPLVDLMESLTIDKE